jgi:hypothetical protein
LTTNTDDIHARVTSIEDGVANVETDVGTIKVRIADSGSQMNATSIFALVAALCSISAAAMMIFTRKTPKTPSTSAVTSPSETPPGESAKTVAPQSEETQKSTATTETQPKPESPVEKPQEAPTQTQTETPAEKPHEEAPHPGTAPPPSNPPDQNPPPEPQPPEEPKPQDQTQQQPEPEMIVVHLEDQPPQQN